MMRPSACVKKPKAPRRHRARPINLTRQTGRGRGPHAGMAHFRRFATGQIVRRSPSNHSDRCAVTLHSKSKSGEDLVGAIKLHFPKTEPLDEEQANLVSAMGNEFCRDQLWKDGSPLPAQCMVIDLASGNVYPGIKSIKQRLKKVSGACSQVASLWPGVTQQVVAYFGSASGGNGPNEGGLCWSRHSYRMIRRSVIR